MVYLAVRGGKTERTRTVKVGEWHGLTAKDVKRCSKASLLMGFTSASSFANILWMASLTKSTFARPPGSCRFDEAVADRYLEVWELSSIIRRPLLRRLATAGRHCLVAILATVFMVQECSVPLEYLSSWERALGASKYGDVEVVILRSFCLAWTIQATMYLSTRSTCFSYSLHQSRWFQNEVGSWTMKSIVGVEVLY